MPKIPLIRNGEEPRTANAPAAVKDTLRRPRVNNSGVASAIGGLAAADKPVFAPDALAGPDKSMAAIGNAIAQAGSLAGGLAIKRREAQTDIQMDEAETRIREARAEFQAKMQETDPSTWRESWQAEWDSIESELQGREGLTGGSEEKLPLLLREARSNTSIEIGIQADKRTFALAARGNKAGAYRAVEAQDEELFEEIIETGESRGYLYPDESVTLRKQFKAEGERQQREAESAQKELDTEDFLAMMQQDPDNAVELLDDEFMFSSFDESDKIKFKGIAQRHKQRVKSEGYEDLRNGVIGGRLSEADIVAQAEKLKFTEEETAEAVDFRRRFIKAEAEAGPIDWVKAGKLNEEIDKFDPSSMPKEKAVKIYGAFLERIAIDAVGADGDGTQGALYNKLKNKHPYYNRRPVSDLPSGIESELTRIIDLDRTLGTWGDLKDDDGKLIPETNRAALEAENNLRREIKSDLEETPEKFREPGAVQDWYNAKMRGARTGKAVQQWSGGTSALFPKGELPEDESERLQDIIDFKR